MKEPAAIALVFAAGGDDPAATFASIMFKRYIVTSER
jgi:hypothetical protein